MMRDFGKVSPRFWIGETGKALRGQPEAQLLAIYLMTSPHSEMTGVFYCPHLFMSHETGLTPEAVMKGLARLIEMDFCTFDAEHDVIFVHEMAAYQIGADLTELDKRVVSVQRWFEAQPDGVIRQGFFERHNQRFFLSPRASPLQGASKPEEGKEEEKAKGKGKGAEGPQDPAVPAPVPGWLPPDAWHAYLTTRRGQGLVMTPNALSLALKKLTELRADGHDPRTVLEQSILNDWRGLFPVSRAGPGKKSGSGNRQEGIEAQNRKVAARLAAGMTGAPS